MIKKTILLTIGMCVAAQVAVAQQEQQSVLDNYIIATDLDDVLLKGNFYERAMGALRPSNLLMSGAYGLACLTHFKPGTKFSRACGEALYIAELRKNNGVETRAAQFVRMMAQQKLLMPDTLEIYKQLHALGASFFTATNIGSIFFNDLRIKFPDEFNDQFIKDGLTVDYGATDVIEKPDVRYFQALHAKIDPSGTKTIIFIDDKLENVEGARKAGLIGVQFKNAQQLKDELELVVNVSLSSN